ncbi:MAG: sodium-dependent transporter [Candidatus Aminicenantes bacterium]|nr:MAG: sodium-dependent transporter [Candidatus Aminicenantes bacterium]
MESQEISGRGIWGSKVAFILAATGSAIGLGNIWRFPTVASQNGGAVFVFVYILAVVFIGFTVMLAELTIGRHAQKNPVGAFEYIKPGSPWKLVGYGGVITGIFILSFYAVVAGWAAGYIFKTAAGAFKGKLTAEMSNQIFADFSSDPLQVFIFFGLIMGLTIFIISKGVKKGIEKWTKILMPALFLLIVLLAIRALTLPGAGQGIAFYLKPDFSKLNGTVILFAVGQAFFSLSLGMGTMITYGSYISKSDNLVSSAGWVSFSDTLIALLAGLIIFPTLAFSGQPADVGGEGLAFQIFPLILSQLPGGYIFGILFFTLLTVAALTSTISLLEVPVAYLVDEKNWSRKKAVFVIGIITIILGIPSALSTGGMQFFTKLRVLSIFVFVFQNIALPVGAFFICIFVGYVWRAKKALKEIASGNPRFKLRPIWVFSLMFLTPVAILFILYFIKTISG